MSLLQMLYTMSYVKHVVITLNILASHFREKVITYTTKSKNKSTGNTLKDKLHTEF